MAVLGPPTFALVTHSTSHSEILQAFIPFGSPRSFDVHNLKTKTYKTNRENCRIINFFKKISFLIEKIYNETKLFVIARGKSGQKAHFFLLFQNVLSNVSQAKHPPLLYEIHPTTRQKKRYNLFRKAFFEI